MRRSLNVIFILVSGYITFVALIEWNAKKDWDSLRNQVVASPSDLLPEYERLASVLEYDSKFQIEYAAFLIEENRSGDAILILKGSHKRFFSRTSVESLAAAYQKSGDMQKAIGQYDWLCNYLPNKFEPKYRLLNLYLVVKDTGNTKRIGNMIMNMPVKVKSRAIDDIRMNTEKILSKLK